MCVCLLCGSKLKSSLLQRVPQGEVLVDGAVFLAARAGQSGGILGGRHGQALVSVCGRRSGRREEGDGFADGRVAKEVRDQQILQGKDVDVVQDGSGKLMCCFTDVKPRTRLRTS